jgi:membrane fusion protein, multidrug efflux system
MSKAAWAQNRRVRALGALVLAFLVSGCEAKKPPGPPPPPQVQVLTVGWTNFPVVEEWIGTTEGFVNAQIRAQVTGYLQSQDYAEGSRVKKGDLLFQIDPRPFQAALDQALGKLAQDRAQQHKTLLDVQRYGPLAKEQALSEETYIDAQQANLAAEAQIQADEAAVETARLNLGFTRITSPVDGLAGTALAQIGDLVTLSSPLLTTVSTVDPIRVYFQASEQSYLSFWRHLAASTNRELPLELVLSDGSVYRRKGRFFYADRQVNPTTGTLQIAGLFPNPEYELRPGQYALVRAQTRVETNAVVVPQRTVTQLQGGYHVAVVGADNKVTIKAVKVGPQVGSGWIVEKGLEAGDRVVVEGTQKVKPGTVVNVQPAPAPGTNGPVASAQD